MRLKYIITALGPIDRYKPGEDVTDVYPAETLDRLVREGYVEIAPPEILVVQATKKRGKR